MTIDHLIKRYEELRRLHGNALFLSDAVDGELVWLERVMPEWYVYPADWPDGMECCPVASAEVAMGSEAGG